ncbi:MAG: hypothetical protein HOV80_38335 [Polyangiaceae bacterium]|nr:hypothetical protein [Polyangiaceae bacterium]
MLPLPEDADAAFDGEFVSATLNRGPGFAIDSLMTLPLTKERASRLLQLAIDHHRVWELDRLDEVAALAGPVARGVPLPPTAGALKVYRLLVGSSADEKIQQALDTAIEQKQLYEATRIGQLAPELVSAEQRSAIFELASGLSIASLAALEAEHPWLLSSSDVVAAATQPDRSWGLPNRLPGYLLPVIEAKVAATSDPHFAVELLDRMEALGCPRRKILGVALKRLVRDPTTVPAAWLSQRLDSKSLWEEPGTEIVATLLRQPTRSQAAVVYEICQGRPHRQAGARGRRRRYCSASSHRPGPPQPGATHP